MARIYKPVKPSSNKAVALGKETKTGKATEKEKKESGGDK